MPLNSKKKSNRKTKVLPQFSVPLGKKPPLDLLEIQRKSFFYFLEHGIPHELAKTNTFRETAKNATFARELELILNPETYTFVSPNCTPKQAILNGKTYACKLYVQATLKIQPLTTVGKQPHTEEKRGASNQDISNVLGEKALHTFHRSAVPRKNTQVDQRDTEGGRSAEIKPIIYLKRRKKGFSFLPLKFSRSVLSLFPSIEKLATPLSVALSLQFPLSLYAEGNKTFHIFQSNVFSSKDCLPLLSQPTKRNCSTSSSFAQQSSFQWGNKKSITSQLCKMFKESAFLAKQSRKNITGCMRTESNRRLLSCISCCSLPLAWPKAMQRDSTASPSFNLRFFPFKCMLFFRFLRASATKPTNFFIPMGQLRKKRNLISMLTRQTAASIEMNVFKKITENRSACLLQTSFYLLAVSMPHQCQDHSGPLAYFHGFFWKSRLATSMKMTNSVGMQIKELQQWEVAKSSLFVYPKLLSFINSKKEKVVSLAHAYRSYTGLLFSDICTCYLLNLLICYRIWHFNVGSKPVSGMDLLTSNASLHCIPNFASPNIGMGMLGNPTFAMQSNKMYKEEQGKEAIKWIKYARKGAILTNCYLGKKLGMSIGKESKKKRAYCIFSKLKKSNENPAFSGSNTLIINHPSIDTTIPSFLCKADTGSVYPLLLSPPLLCLPRRGMESIGSSMHYFNQLASPVQSTKKLAKYPKDVAILDVIDEDAQIFRPWLFLGELPLMTKRGHFILNGSPRVIVNQIARCPGIYFQEKRRGVGFEQEVRVSADLIPQRGPWLRIQSDWEGRFWARLKQEGRIKYATLFEAFQEFEKQYNAPIVNLLSNSSSLFPKSEIAAFQERKTKEERQKKALTRLFKNSMRYSLGDLGRARINERIHLRLFYESGKLGRNVSLSTRKNHLPSLLLTSLKKLVFNLSVSGTPVSSLLPLLPLLPSEVQEGFTPMEVQEELLARAALRTYNSSSSTKNNASSCYSALWTMDTGQCTMHNAQCTMHNAPSVQRCKGAKVQRYTAPTRFGNINKAGLPLDTDENAGYKVQRCVDDKGKESSVFLQLQKDPSQVKKPQNFPWKKGALEDVSLLKNLGNPSGLAKLPNFSLRDSWKNYLLINSSSIFQKPSKTNPLQDIFLAKQVSSPPSIATAHLLEMNVPYSRGMLARHTRDFIEYPLHKIGAALQDREASQSFDCKADPRKLVHVQGTRKKAKKIFFSDLFEIKKWLYNFHSISIKSSFFAPAMFKETKNSLFRFVDNRIMSTALQISHIKSLQSLATKSSFFRFNYNKKLFKNNQQLSHYKTKKLQLQSLKTMKADPAQRNYTFQEARSKQSKNLNAFFKPSSSELSTLLMVKDIEAIHVYLERLLEGQGFTDDIDHLKNRFIRTSGKLLQQQFELGLYRLSEVITPLLGNLLQNHLALLKNQPNFRAFGSPQQATFSINKRISTPLLQNRPNTNTCAEPLKDVQHIQTLPSIGNKHKMQTYGDKTLIAALSSKAGQTHLNGQEKRTFITYPTNFFKRKAKSVSVLAKVNAMHNAQCTMDNGQYTMHNAQCTFGAKVQRCKGANVQRCKDIIVHCNKGNMLAGTPNMDCLYKVAPIHSLLRLTPSTPATGFLRRKQEDGINIQPKEAIVGRKIFSGIHRDIEDSSIKQEKAEQLSHPSDSVRACEAALRGTEKKKSANSGKTSQTLLLGTNSQNTGIIAPFRWLRTSKPINSAFREFFGSNPLSQYMDQTNPLAEITHKRRLSSMGPGGIKRETAGMEVRGIHPTHYGRMCPIETPEGKNAGLVNSPTVYGRVNKDGFLETPLHQVIANQMQIARWTFFSAQQEEGQESSLATCDTGLKRFNFLAEGPIPVQTASNPLAHFQQVERNRVEYRALSPVQTISIATALIPFLEHDDANRALMGSNMQRQAIPLLLPERPIVGTGFEPLVVAESGQALQATELGWISYINANSVVVHSINLIRKAMPHSVLRNTVDNKSFSLATPSASSVLVSAIEKITVNSVSKKKNKTTLREQSKRPPLHSPSEGRACYYAPSIFLERILSRYVKVESYAGKSTKKEISQKYEFPIDLNLASNELKRKPAIEANGNTGQQPYAWPSAKQGACKTGKKTNPMKMQVILPVLPVLPVLPKEVMEAFTSMEAMEAFTSMEAQQDIVNTQENKTVSGLSFSHNILSLTPVKESLQLYQRSNQETCLNQRPTVQEGDWVQRGDFLADCSASHSGDLALGKNVTVAYMPWEGYNFEDAIVISERLVSDDVYTSLHIERYEIKVSKNSQGKEKITNRIPGAYDSLKHLDNLGIARISSWVQPGDILVGKVVELKRPLSPYERLAWELASRLSPASPEREKWLNKVWLEDISLRLPPGVCGRVVNSQIVSTEWSEKEQIHYPLEVHVYLAVKRKIQIGDKLAGRHGNKGIVSTILPQQDMPYLANGQNVDMVLNPLGVPSRMNLGQIFECLLGLAGSQLGCHFKMTPFDEIAGGEASRSLVFLKLYQCRLLYNQQWLFTPTFPGKSRLFDGRTGEPFENWVTVGQAYMLKLIHMVDHKIHARSTGPYSLFTRQPVRGRSRRGGQRLGEMEVWAVEGFGAAYTLQEFLTIKSDDLKARTALQRSFYKQNDVTFKKIHISPGNPEAFKVLVSELQALCLHIQI